MANRTENQGVFIGSASSPSTTSTVASFNESTLPYGGALGQLYRVGDKWYRLVQLEASAAIAGADGRVAFWYDKANYKVTSTVVRSFPNKPAGLFIGALTIGYYGFIQVEGIHSTAAVTAAAGAAVGGLACVCDTASSGLCLAWAAASQYIGGLPRTSLGVFVDTSISGVAPVDLMLRRG